MSKRRASPEAALQIAVHNMLKVRLPEGMMWTASLTGVWLPPGARMKAKAMGVRRGWPDLSFLCPDGVIRTIELKAGASLSKEQRAFRDAASPEIWALCRSVDEVVAALVRWGVQLRPDPFAPA